MTLVNLGSRQEFKGHQAWMFTTKNQRGIAEQWFLTHTGGMSFIFMENIHVYHAKTYGATLHVDPETFCVRSESEVNLPPKQSLDGAEKALYAFSGVIREYLDRAPLPEGEWSLL